MVIEYPWMDCQAAVVHGWTVRQLLSIHGWTARQLLPMGGLPGSCCLPMGIGAAERDWTGRPSCRQQLRKKRMESGSLFSDS